VPLVAAVNEEPFIVRDPVMFTDPVNWCVFANEEPNLVDPVTKSTLLVIV
jgi:hypothetical protein